MKVIELETLFGVPNVSSYDVSDASLAKFAYSTNRSGIWQICLGDIQQVHNDGSQITTGMEMKVNPIFTRDGLQVLYESDFRGDEKFDLYCINLATKEVRNLTPFTDYWINPNATLSRDGSRVAFVSNQSGERFASYYLELNVPPSEIKRVSFHDYSDEYALISPDGEKIAFSSIVSAQSSGIFVSTLDEPQKNRAVRLSEKSKPIDANSPSWSEDSKCIAFVSAERGFYDVGIWSSETEDIRWLTKSDREGPPPCFLA